MDLIKQTQQEDTRVGWMKSSSRAAHLLGDVGSLFKDAEFWGFSKDLLGFSFLFNWFNRLQKLDRPDDP